MTRSPGELVVLQEVWRGRVWAAKPTRVVRDEGDLVALWLPKGARWKAPTTPPTRPRERTRGERLATCLVRGEWVHVDAVWDVSTLLLMREGDWHAIWCSWLDSGEQWGWYVNLQRPFTRTRHGFATMDLMLDVIVELDGTWRWKDEDELQACVERGAFDGALARRVREEGMRVVQRAKRGEPPFCEPWGDWRPDPRWSPAELPSGWDEVTR
ncbi:MAG: DUF402 domain-containing protein [Thermoleophilia bacterium]|nr:DUF402 domain-containing protein [Thermoleophilia bacterium]